MDRLCQRRVHRTGRVRANVIKMARPTVALVTVLAFLFSTVGAPLAEAQFWQDRRRAVSQTKKNSNSSAVFASVAGMGAFHSLTLPSEREGTWIKNKWTGLAQLLPFEYGSVRGMAVPQGIDTGRRVMLIQDVHMNTDAQRHISSAVKSLATRGGATVVALEGAFGPLDLTAYQTYPDHSVMRVVADFLLREHHVSGPVHAALTEPSFPPLVGVDDRDLYNANVQAYRDAAPKIDTEEAALVMEETHLQADQKRLLNSAAQLFVRTMEAYHNNKISLSAYVEALVKSSGNQSLPPVVCLFRQAIDLEKTLDRRRVELERRSLLETLARDLSPEEVSDLTSRSLAYREGRASYADFYEYLSQLCHAHGLPLSHFPAMDNYVRYVLLADRMDAADLHNALAILEISIYTALGKTAEERRLLQQIQFHCLKKKLADFSLTPAEWARYQSLKREGGERGPFERFYLYAQARDNAMAHRLIEEMDRSQAKTAVLVIGGYHAPGVTACLTKAGVTVIQFTPKIEKIDTPTGAAYLSVFAREKTPLEKLLLGEKLFLASPPLSPSAAGMAAEATAAVNEINNGISKDYQDETKILNLFSPGSSLEMKAEDRAPQTAEVRIGSKQRGYISITFRKIGEILTGTHRRLGPGKALFSEDSNRSPWRTRLSLLWKSLFPHFDSNEEIEKARATIPPLVPRSNGTKPRVSILILNHHTGKPFVRLIDSMTKTVRARVDIEIVVVDNEASDESQSLLNKATDQLKREGIALTVITNEENVGASVGRNQGLTYALSEERTPLPDYVLTLDSDVTLDPYVIEDLVAWAEQEPINAVAFAPPTHFFSQPHRLQATAAIPRMGLPAQWELDRGFRHPLNHGKPVGSLATSTVLFRASAFKEVGFFDPRYFFALEDTQWFSRAESLGRYARIVPVRGQVLHDAHSSLGGARSPARAYFLARNILFLARDEGRRGFVPRKTVRAVYTLALLVTMNLWRRDAPVLRAVFAGIYDGILGRGGIGRGNLYLGRGPPEKGPNPRRLPWKTRLYFALNILGTMGFALSYIALIDWGQSSVVLAILITFSTVCWGWAIAELLLDAAYYLLLPLINGPFRFREAETSNGLPVEGKTLIAYLLRSTDVRDSKRTIDNMVASYLSNLDPEGRVTAVLTCASAKLSIVRAELDLRDEARRGIRSVILEEGKTLLNKSDTDMSAFLPLDHPRRSFWMSVVHQWENESMSPDRRVSALQELAERSARHFLYVHRSTTVLRKQGQYLDLMALASRGLELPYTYLSETYGTQGRPAHRPNFGYVPHANLENDEGLSNEMFENEANNLALRGADDLNILLEAGRSYGTANDQSYRFTALADSDTLMTPNSVRQMVGIGIANPERGMVQPSLLARGAPTWFAFWAVVENVEPSMFSQGVFYALDRQGFFGKGVANNDLFLDRFMGTPESPVEQTPLGILSHDTAEALHLNPAFSANLIWLEEAQKNPVSAHFQMRRWLTGDILNLGYFFPRTFGALLERIRAILRAPPFFTSPRSRLEKEGLTPYSGPTRYLAYTTLRHILQTPMALLWIMAMTFLTGAGLPLVPIPTNFSTTTYLISMIVFLLVPKMLSLRHLFMSLGFLLRRDLPRAKMSFQKWGRVTLRNILEIVIDPFLRLPEGPRRVVILLQAMWTVITGRTSWKVQAEVDRETQSLTFWGALKYSWYIPGLVGLVLLVIFFRGLPVHILFWLLLLPWVLSPLTIWLVSQPISAKHREGRFVRWLAKDVPTDRWTDETKEGSWFPWAFYSKRLAAVVESFGLLTALPWAGRALASTMGIDGLGALFFVSGLTVLFAPWIYERGHVWFGNPKAAHSEEVQSIRRWTTGTALLAGLTLFSPSLSPVYYAAVILLTLYHQSVNVGLISVRRFQRDDVAERVEDLLRGIPLDLGVGQNPSHGLQRGRLLAESAGALNRPAWINSFRQGALRAGVLVNNLQTLTAVLRSTFFPGKRLYFVPAGVSEKERQTLSEDYARLNPIGADTVRFVVPDATTKMRVIPVLPGGTIVIIPDAFTYTRRGIEIQLVAVESALSRWLENDTPLSLFSTARVTLSLNGVTHSALRDAAEAFRLILEALGPLSPTAEHQLEMVDKVAGAVSSAA